MLISQYRELTDLSSAEYFLVAKSIASAKTSHAISHIHLEKLDTKSLLTRNLFPREQTRQEVLYINKMNVATKIISRGLVTPVIITFDGQK